MLLMELRVPSALNCFFLTACVQIGVPSSSTTCSAVSKSFTEKRSDWGWGAIWGRECLFLAVDESLYGVFVLHSYIICNKNFEPWLESFEILGFAVLVAASVLCLDSLRTGLITV